MEQDQEKSIAGREIIRLASGGRSVRQDQLAVEEPLEIRVGSGPRDRRRYDSLAVTMRTPGDDFNLALGFLFTEGIIGKRGDVEQLRFAGELLEAGAKENIVLAELTPELQFDAAKLSRHFYTASSCGICGKASLDLVRTSGIFLLPPAGRPSVQAELLIGLPDRLAREQTIFARTGGIHAAALFRTDGELVLLHEDVGRHNALDKLIGAALHAGLLPLRDYLVLVSGRASFELVQKAVMAGIPILAAVGAASSLAVDLADEAGMTLLGFLRDGQCNCYCGAERLVT